jgi:predicted TPR repeat methyltransferase
MTLLPAQAALHDAYAAEYDEQVRAYECYLAEALFGLCYEYVRPGDRLLDVGIGSGLAAAPFAGVGLRVSGMDFSAAMLDLCRAKGIAEELHRRDAQDVPWPFSSGAFDHVIACGLFHFIPDLEPIVEEVARVARPGGLFAFTTKEPASSVPGRRYDRHASGDFDIFDHEPDYVAGLLARNSFQPMRTLRCFVGDHVFTIWVARRSEMQ